MAISYIDLASVFEQKQNKNEAKIYYQFAKQHFAELVSRFPENHEFKDNELWVEKRLSEK
ncbi:hypothetical protein EXU57_24065 [Segetibacter sp. 3557_3]|uniref:hypothetical protein n=1 Tax=Segetibacter sp. 3557_3 TaxID=2547429 RepID=UPI0010584CD1|nr:hypothetical protein [Segetibacter sp. 3557_3]TDH18257.1 hypothetical protein EXU57_24065 [Segetibacter sp. 3557_3]